MGSNEYGYIGDTPTQSTSSNNGVFGSEDIYDLLAEDKWALQTFDAEYLVIAGGGSGGKAYQYGSGGGGAGGYRNSYASETTGGGGSTESTLTLVPSTSYTVTVGAGASSYSGPGS